MAMFNGKLLVIVMNSQRNIAQFPSAPQSILASFGILFWFYFYNFSSPLSALFLVTAAKKALINSETVSD